ncbi:MAG: helix-turn-helix domain-containing protein, partial [Nanoarchaeota archaeon]
MNPEQVLQQGGLTEAEVKLYVTLLSSGEATASELAKKTTTNRTFTYDRLNRLVNIGLASHIVKDNKKYFKAAEPSQFLALLKERETQLQLILPQLEALKVKAHIGPQVTVFSSKKGVQTALNLILREKKPVFMHGSLLKFQSSVQQYFEVWNARRVKAKIQLKVLTPEDFTNIKLENAEVQELPEEEKTAITTFTFGDKTVTAFWSDVPVAILIESIEIAKNNTAFFNAIWNREVKIYSGVDGIIKAFYELIANKNGYYLGVGYS